MKRRKFIQSMGALGAAFSAPSFFTNSHFIKSASAAPLIGNVDFVVPARLPQVINIFLYGGPSELGGNLTNIAEINANSQNPYTTVENDILQQMNPADPAANGQITRHGFWKEAGGLIMEGMLATGDLSVYRTIYRRKENTRAHRPSILSSQKGNLDIEISGGVGTTLASVLYANKATLDGSALLGGRQLEELLLPFVSFEGESSAFAADASAGSIQLPLQLKGISMDQNFANPYSRDRGIGDEAVIDALVNKIAGGTSSSRFQKVTEGFINRQELQNQVAGLSAAIDPVNAATYLPNIGIGVEDADANGVLAYPNNDFARRVKAAVTLAMQNPDSLYLTIGGGLGGWDDHNNAIEEYKERMEELMTTLRVAAKHIRLGTRSGAYAGVPTDNIIINVHGDFGRNVNLNGSMGWDHGNNQNLYTIGGAGIRPAGALGKVVGSTVRIGDAGENRQFTSPATNSYEVEPMSIASTVYSYFGVQNPQELTKDSVKNSAGDPPIDETVAGEAVLF